MMPLPGGSKLFFYLFDLISGDLAACSVGFLVQNPHFVMDFLEYPSLFTYLTTFKTSEFLSRFFLKPCEASFVSCLLVFWTALLRTEKTLRHLKIHLFILDI